MKKILQDLMIYNQSSLIFFGFGQPHLEPVPENGQNDQNMEVQQDAQGAWGLWPEQPANQIEQQGLNVQHEVAFDLNEPGEAPLEDPGLVENVPGHVDEPLPQHLIDGDVIVASSDSEGHNEEAAPAVQQIPILPDLNAQVEVFIPMEDGHPLQLIPDEIPEEELVPDFNEVDNAVQEQPHSPGAPDAMHLGFVSLPDDLGDHVFIKRLQQQLHSDVFKQNPDAIRLWARFLAPGPGASSVKVPRIWADFFTALLLNPGSYEWAKKMLQSQAWEFFQKTNCESVPFCLPSARLIDKTLFCDAHASVGITSPPDQIQSPEGTPSQALLPDKIKEKVVTTPGPQSQQLLDLAAQNKISDQALCPANRRSARKKDQLKWYKSSACASKNCLGCDVVPPTISPSIIKNLGASFCKVDADKLTVEALGKKSKVAAPGGKKQSKKPSSQDPSNEDVPKPSKKKPKK
jgi:hypothetical protein